MNKVVLMGRLTKDPETRVTSGTNQMTIARYTLAIDRKKTKNNDNPGADFIPCVVFGHGAEFAEKYLKKGIKVVIEGRIQTGSYTNKEGQKVYTTDVVVEAQEFAESKRGLSEEDKNARDMAAMQAGGYAADEQGFMNIPDGLEDELPFA